MSNILSPEDISRFLEVEPETIGNCWTWKLFDHSTESFLFLSIYYEIEHRDKTGNLVSVQTKFGYFELHNFNRIVLFEPNEISFVQFNDEKINCLIVGKNCTCSLYSNIDRELVRSNMTEIDPAFLLSSLQLALLEEVIS